MLKYLVRDCGDFCGSKCFAKDFLMKRLAVFFALLFCISSIPFALPTQAKADGSIYIKSETAVLIDAQTGAVLYDKNMNRQMHPASITKIMTGMLALEMASPDQMLTTSHNAVYSLPYNTSHIALGENEQLTLEQAMYALGIESANDAANVIAENLAGSNEAFAQLMTQKAHDLGAVNTNFTNPHGLPDDNHYTTAYDMALIAAEAIKNESFNRYFSTNRYDMSPTNIRSEMRQFWNANYFINGYEQCEGLIMSKTGWTQEARHTLVTAAKRGETTLVAVVMYSTGKGDKFDDTLALFDYGFNGYTTVQVTDDYIKSSMPAKLECAEGEIAVQQEDCMTGAVYVTAPVGTQEKDITVSVGTAQVDESGSMATVTATLYYSKGGTQVQCGQQTVTLILEHPPAKRFDFTSFALKAFLWLVLIFLVLVVLLLLLVALRQVVIIENRRRIRKRRMQQKDMAKNQKTVQEKTVYRK